MKKTILKYTNFTITLTVALCIVLFCFSRSVIHADAASIYKKTAITTKICHLKSSASSTSNTIATIKEFKSITALSVTKNGWRKVKYKSKTGYIKSSSVIVGRKAKALKKKLANGTITSVGTFKTTAYCWTGNRTASGVFPKANHTVAVDPSIISLGTKVYINGKTYKAEDTGVKNKTIDIYMNSYRKAINWGVKYYRVYVYS